MKNLFIFLLTFVYCSINAQVIFEHDFDDGLAPMTIVDVDGLTSDIEGGIFDDAWSLNEVLADGDGNQAVVSNSRYSPPGQSDDWMMTPAIEGVTASSIVRWEAVAISISTSESYSVYVSTEGNTVDDFLAGEEIFSIDAESSTLTERSAGLGNYAGQTIYLAWRNQSNDQFLLLVDNISVIETIPFDITVDALAASPYYEIDDIVYVKSTIVNEGASELNSFDVEWTIDGNNYTESFSGLSVAPYTAYEFTLSDPITISEAVSYNYTVNVSNPNGEMDGNLSNNTSSAAIFGLSSFPTKNVVVEEATGTWCQYCPSGTVAMEYMEENYPETFIGIAVHNGDPMTVPAYDAIMAETIAGYPSSNIGRFIFNVSPTTVNLDSLHNQLVNKRTPVSVSQTVAFDETTRELTVVAEANFVTQLSQEMRFSVIITEDGVTGTSNGYNQANAFAGGAEGPLPPFDTLPDPVPASQMVYDHVGRALLGGYYGTENSIEAEVFDGDTKTFTYNYTIPEMFDVNNINIIALAIKSSTGEIMNADKVHLSDLIVSNQNVYHNDLVNVYPNPFSDQAVVELDINTVSEVNIQLINSMGQVVVERNYGSLSGKNVLPINGTNLSDGIYMVHITMDDVSITKRVTVFK